MSTNSISTQPRVEACNNCARLTAERDEWQNQVAKHFATIQLLTAENKALRDELDRLASAIFWAREALVDVSKNANHAARKECGRQAEILDRDLAELRIAIASTNTEGR